MSCRMKGGAGLHLGHPLKLGQMTVGVGIAADFRKSADGWILLENFQGLTIKGQRKRYFHIISRLLCLDDEPSLPLFLQKMLFPKASEVLEKEPGIAAE